MMKPGRGRHLRTYSLGTLSDFLFRYSLPQYQESLWHAPFSLSLTVIRNVQGAIRYDNRRLITTLRQYSVRLMVHALPQQLRSALVHR